MKEILICAIISLFFSLITIPYWIHRSKQHKLLITDVQKVPAREIAYMAGVPVTIAATLGILCYIAWQTFGSSADNTTALLASVCTILLALIIGMLDDLLGEKIGLRAYQKTLLTLFAALPLIVVNAGNHVMKLPIIGTVEFGNWYAFAIVPVAIVGASNGFNMLAGANGLESGMALLTLGALSYLAFTVGNPIGGIIAVCMLAATLVFFFYNKYPASILPGDSFTYALGASIAIIAILGNLERGALMLFSLYFVELALKIRGRFKKESLAKANWDGTITNKYKRIYSLNHLSITLLEKTKGSAREKSMVRSILATQLLIVLLTIASYTI